MTKLGSNRIGYGKEALDQKQHVYQSVEDERIRIGQMWTRKQAGGPSGHSPQ